MTDAITLTNKSKSNHPVSSSSTSSVQREKGSTPMNETFESGNGIKTQTQNHKRDKGQTESYECYYFYVLVEKTNL